MLERWKKSLRNIPKIDMRDIKVEHSLFNNNKQIENRHQHHPEFTQTSYLRLRSLEEAMNMNNYLDPKYNPLDHLTVTQKLSKQIKSTISTESQISQYDRSYAI